MLLEAIITFIFSSYQANYYDSIAAAKDKMTLFQPKPIFLGINNNQGNLCPETEPVVHGTSRQEHFKILLYGSLIQIMFSQCYKQSTNAQRPHETMWVFSSHFILFITGSNSEFFLFVMKKEQQSRSHINRLVLSFMNYKKQTIVMVPYFLVLIFIYKKIGFE